MKKTNQLIVVFSVVMFSLLASCKCPDCTNETETSKVESPSKPKQAISYDYAKKIQQEYIKTRADSLNKLLNAGGVIKGEDVRDVWFDLKTLEQYIAYVKAESKKKNYEGLGLRVYYGAYPKDSNSPDSGYSTVFFIPTHRSKASKMNFVYSDPNENSEDIDGMNFGIGGKPPKDI